MGDVRTAAGVYPSLTTRHRLAMAETRAVLGIPDEVKIYAVIPLGYPRGRFGEAPRQPVREVAHRDRWGAPFAPIGD